MVANYSARSTETASTPESSGQSISTIAANDRMSSANLAKFRNYAQIVQDLSYRCSVKPLRAQYRSVILEHTPAEAKDETDTSSALRIHYLGDGSQLSYLQSLCFANQFTILAEQTLKLTEVVSGKFPQETADLRVYDFDFPAQKLLQPQGIGIPYWLKQKIQINGSWEEYLGRMRRKTRREAQRMIRKFELETAVVAGSDFGETFYEQLYKPYIERRHGESSVIIAKPEFMARIAGSEIIQLLFQGQVIAAAQLNVSDTVLSIGWTGVREQDLDKGLRGAADALDYFCMKYAFDNGCTAIDMGHSRAVLSDGILKYKKKWGANINTGVVPQGKLVFQFLANAEKSCSEDEQISDHPALQFLANNPLLSLHNGALTAHILLPEPIAEKNQEVGACVLDISAVLDDNYIEGLKNFSVYSAEKVEWPSFTEPECAVRRQVYSGKAELIAALNQGIKE